MSYWVDRELQHIQSQVTQDKLDKNSIASFSRRAMVNIENELLKLLSKYSSIEGISMADAKERADRLDIRDFEDKAKEYVENKTINSKVNAEMRLYNLKMNMSRLQLIKNQLAVEMAKYQTDVESFANKRLTEEALKEVKRQAGIFKSTAKFSEKAIKEILNGSFKQNQFSNIWAKDVDFMKATLEKTLDNALNRGEHPTKLVSELRTVFEKSSAFEARRLLVNETAHIQTRIQLSSFNKAGFDKVEFVAQPNACDKCGQYNGKIFSIDKIEYLGAKPPIHPHCRCSLIPSYEDKLGIFRNEVGGSGS